MHSKSPTQFGAILALLIYGLITFFLSASSNGGFSLFLWKFGSHFQICKSLWASTFTSELEQLEFFFEQYSFNGSFVDNGILAKFDTIFMQQQNICPRIGATTSFLAFLSYFSSGLIHQNHLLIPDVCRFNLSGTANAGAEWREFVKLEQKGTDTLFDPHDSYLALRDRNLIAIGDAAHETLFQSAHNTKISAHSVSNQQFFATLEEFNAESRAEVSAISQENNQNGPLGPFISHSAHHAASLQKADSHIAQFRVRAQTMNQRVGSLGHDRSQSHGRVQDRGRKRGKNFHESRGRSKSRYRESGSKQFQSETSTSDTVSSTDSQASTAAKLTNIWHNVKVDTQTTIAAQPRGRAQAKDQQGDRSSARDRSHSRGRDQDRDRSGGKGGKGKKSTSGDAGSDTPAKRWQGVQAYQICQLR